MNTPLKRFLCLISLFMAPMLFGELEGLYQIDAKALAAEFKALPDFEAASEEEQQRMLGMVDQMQIAMTLKEDGSFTVVADMMGQHNEAGGTYEVLDGVLVLTTSLENGELKETPEIARFKVEGDHFVIREDGMAFALVLRKAE